MTLSTAPVRKILVIDDEEDICDIAAMSLELTTNWQIRTARSGVEGIELAIANPPDAILMDVIMPGLDGPATLQRLRASAATSAIPVIFLTARVQESDRIQFAQLGATAVVNKPFEAGALAGRLAALLGWSEGLPA